MHSFSTDGSYDYYRYHLVVANKNSLMFSLKACSDGHVGLSEIPGLSSLNMYEVVIGGWTNTKSVIRRARQGKIEVEAQTPDILSCDLARYFWVTWEDGVIQMGTGGVLLQGTILTFTDPEPYTVNSVTLATSDGYTGRWNIAHAASMRT